MEFNRILFPAPLSSYNALDPDLIWIPNTKQPSFLKRLLGRKGKDSFIPAFFLPYLNYDRD